VLTRFLFGRKNASLRGLALIPALVALLFVGHAIEDGGPSAATPYIVIIILSASYVVRPTVLAWILLFTAFAAYGVIVAGLPANGPRGEWILFMLLGFGPALLLWVARPRAVFGARTEKE
jgi:hypothetical protein